MARTMRVPRSFGWALLLLAAGVAVAGCRGSTAHDSGAASSSGPILVGEYGSLTGSEATFGTSADAGIQLAVQEINDAGGINGRPVQVKVEDNQSQTAEAANAVQKLITRERVVAVLGEVASGRSMAGAPICQGNRVPMISPASTNPDVTATGDYIFRVCFIDPFQGTVMAKFAAENLKLKRIAILKDQGQPYSTGLADNFKSAFTRMGGQIVAEEAFTATDTDFKAYLSAIKGRAPDGIFIPGYYTQVGTIGRQARELGIKVPLLGGDGWDSPKLFEAAGTALEGCYFSNHYSAEDPSPAIRNFIQRYKSRYSGQVPDAMAALGYDAMQVLADAMKRARSLSGPDLRDAIAETRDFPGVTGKITIDANRNAQKPAVVLQIKGNSYKYVTTIEP
jgi:branched-chain amino acid transport system substrate-binding protein